MNEQKYLDLMQEVYQDGEWRADRTGTGVSSLFGKQVAYDLKDGFPLLTTKKIHWKSVVHELLWFLSGNTNVSYLQHHEVTIWDKWADEHGDLGPVYGSQWRHWNREINGRHTDDQIVNLIDSIKKDPYSRRHIVTAWNPSELKGMALPPCHCFWQIYVHQNGEIDLQLYQRGRGRFYLATVRFDKFFDHGDRDVGPDLVITASVRTPNVWRRKRLSILVVNVADLY